MTAIVTKDFGGEGNAVLEGMFRRLKLERKTALKKIVTANGEQIQDLGVKTCQIFHLNVESCPSWKRCDAE